MRLHLCAILLLATLLVGASMRLAFPALTHASGKIEAPSGDAACAACHREIYERYQHTPMSQGSGAAAETQGALIPGSFLHQPSGVQYKVFLRDNQAWLSYDRPNDTPDALLNGERRLRYFIGSGHRGRTYLYEEADLWFEAPINYYSKKAVWDMAPNFESSHTMPDGLPVDPTVSTVTPPSCSQLLARPATVTRASRSCKVGSTAPPATAIPPLTSDRTVTDRS